MNKTMSAIKSVYETMVMGKPADMSEYYSQYTKKDLLRFQRKVMEMASAIECDLQALKQQLNDINAEIRNREGGK